MIPRYDLLPPCGLRRAATSMANGQKEHSGDKHYMVAPLTASLHLAHARAHLDALEEGRETGEDDLGNAIARLMMLADVQERRPELFDLPRSH